jgi:hypothetical protein
MGTVPVVEEEGWLCPDRPFVLRVTRRESDGRV